MLSSNITQARSSGSSLQHNVVLHSNINESASISVGNRFELNLLDREDKSISRRQTNSLMTVHEQDPNNDLLTDESWHLRSQTSVSDVTQQRTTDDQSTVNSLCPIDIFNTALLDFFVVFFFRYDKTDDPLFICPSPCVCFTLFSFVFLLIFSFVIVFKNITYVNAIYYVYALSSHLFLQKTLCVCMCVCACVRVYIYIRIKSKRQKKGELLSLSVSHFFSFFLTHNNVCCLIYEKKP
jgi:hypothetical protein